MAPDEEKLNKIMGQQELTQFDVASALRESYDQKTKKQEIPSAF